jgi:hypothetical protein
MDLHRDRALLKAGGTAKARKRRCAAAKNVQTVAVLNLAGNMDMVLAKRSGAGLLYAPSWWTTPGCAKDFTAIEARMAPHCVGAGADHRQQAAAGRVTRPFSAQISAAFPYLDPATACGLNSFGVTEG